MKDDAFTAENLSVNYDKRAVLWDISLAVPSGKLVGIIGPNGAGKSTFIKASLGIIRPTSGTVHLLGSPLKEVRKRVAYVPQRESVDWDFPITLYELVLMGRYGRLGLFRRPSKADKEVVWETLEKVGLAAYSERQISQLSGGQQQRAFLARALVQEADLYFMDEPFTGIDVASTQVITGILHALKESGKTLFVVHHDLASVPELFDWVILLNMRLVACGETKEVFTPEMIHRAFGKDSRLFEEASLLNVAIERGLT